MPRRNQQDPRVPDLSVHLWHYIWKRQRSEVFHLCNKRANQLKKPYGEAGRSINMALTAIEVGRVSRGSLAEEKFLPLAILMQRSKDSDKSMEATTSIPYGKANQAIYSFPAGKFNQL